MNKNKALQKAINLHLSGNNVEASKAYNSVLVLEPSNLIALNNLASLLNVSGEYEKAKLLLNRALHIKPDYIDALNNLGISMKLSKEFNEAVKIFEKIINLKPDVVINTAALKHVPVCEDNPYESVKTNIIGHKNLIDCENSRMALSCRADRVEGININAFQYIQHSSFESFSI